MEIMDTKKYNEKLDIKPMSRSQLMSRSWDIFGQLKDGDVVIVHCDTISGIEDVKFVFVSEESMRKYAYAKTYNFTLYTSNLYSDRQHGTLIAYYSNKFSYTLFSKFRRNGEYKADRSGYIYIITEIRRYDKPPYQPFSDLYFQQIDDYGNYTVLYSNPITKKISEKLNIRPISKSQLGLYKTKTVTINGQIWTAENASTTRANDGTRLVEGVDYFIHNGEYFYTEMGAQKVIPYGWRLPYTNDWYTLFSFVNGDVLSLVSKEYGGTDDYGFGIKFLGIYGKSRMIGENQYANFIIGDKKSTDGRTYTMKFLDKSQYNENGTMWEETLPGVYGISLRFIKNT